MGKGEQGLMRTAVIYYSMSGNTAAAAKKVAEGIGADLIEIKPEKAFPDKGFRKFSGAAKVR
jgi:flavodoxin